MHAETMLATLTPPPPPYDMRRCEAALVKAHDDLRALEIEHAKLVSAHAALTRVKTGRATADFRAELRASGLACVALGGDTYAVASASRLSVTYTVDAPGDDPALWRCGCMASVTVCSHVRRVRQAKASAERRAKRAAVPAAQMVTF